MANHIWHTYGSVMGNYHGFSHFRIFHLILPSMNYESTAPGDRCTGQRQLGQAGAVPAEVEEQWGLAGEAATPWEEALESYGKRGGNPWKPMEIYGKMGKTYGIKRKGCFFLFFSWRHRKNDANQWESGSLAMKRCDFLRHGDDWTKKKLGDLIIKWWSNG